MDVFEPGPGDQLHDLNPGIATSGLFWTVAIPPESVEVSLAANSATMKMTNASVQDYFSIPYALFGGGPAPIPATVSFEVRWRGAGQRVTVRNPAGGLAGDFIRNEAQMEWSATAGPYRFASAGGASSTSSFAEFGRERNGIFLPAGSLVESGQTALESLINSFRR